MRAFCACLGCALAVLSPARADVIATFEDPASGSSTPLFTFDANLMQLSGGWTLSGLNLEGIGGTLNNVTFTMPPISVTALGEVQAGQIEFFLGAESVFLVEFDSAQLSPTVFGATEFLATNEVVFSGSILPLPVENESFAFAFANLVDIGNGGFTATASFTSSADVIPEPASLMPLVLSGFYMRRRGRHRVR